MLRAPTPLMLLVLAAGCDAREPTLDPAEPLAPPGCVMAEPAEVRFEAVGEVFMEAGIPHRAMRRTV